MARYNREFLVPYLENLCALHIAKWKIENKREEISEQMTALNREINMLEEPEIPIPKGTGFVIFELVTGILLAIVSLFGIPVLSLVAGLLGWPLAIGYGIWLYAVKAYNADIEFDYRRAVNAYNQKLEELQRKEDSFNDYAFVHLTLCQSRREEVDEALQKVYSANIIPRRYRDIYVTVYLYDWFSTSMADDLDMALNNYLLEEIKDRLDRIIVQLSKSLRNQRIIIENQEKSIEQQEMYRNEMISKLERLQLTAEEHSSYLSMIEANTAASACFSAAEYIREL